MTALAEIVDNIDIMNYINKDQHEDNDNILRTVLMNLLLFYITSEVTLYCLREKNTDVNTC